jgi:hypothetical protein
MSEQLHPLSLGEVLDRTAQLYRSRFLVYFGIGVIPAGVVLVSAAGVFLFFAWAGSGGSRWATSPAGDALVWTFLAAVGLLILPACLGASALGWAAMSHAAAHAFLGRQITIREAYRSAWKRGWRYTWLFVLLGAIVVGAPSAVTVAAMPFTAFLEGMARKAGLGALAAFLGGLALLLLAVLAAYAVWMLLRLSMAFPASLVEQISAWRAVKRASALSQGTKGRIFLLFLLGVALSWILALGLSLPVGILLTTLPSSHNPREAQMMGMILVFIWYALWFAVQALTKPVYGIALTLFYFDQRMRKEGFDIEWMMEAAGLGSVGTLPGEGTLGARAQAEELQA